MPPAAEIDLGILEALAEEPSLSQRELAKRAGLSLTRAHFVLKRLAEKGLIKVKNVAASNHKLGYLYLLTPQGIEEKARLTHAFMHRTAAQYQGMVDRLERAVERGLLQVERNGSPVRVAIVGEGPLREVLQDLLHLRDDVICVPELDAARLAIEVEPGARSSNQVDETTSWVSLF